MRKLLLTLILTLTSLPILSGKEVQKDNAFVKVDFSQKNGRIKELHGTNNSPVKLNSTIKEFTDAGIPFVRLHDAAGAFGGTRYVDIGNVFPNFDADADDPNSYDFAFTDAYLKTLVDSKVKIFYRLGTTIENNWKIKAYTIKPPKDNLKWAKICAGIIRHYNEGWANGFHYDIQYWEIYNEPENPAMWQGSRDQFFELYSVTSKYLKEKFPNIKIGGYASVGFYAITNPALNNRLKEIGVQDLYEWFLNFLKMAKEKSLPLDFFSWHSYSNTPEEIYIQSQYAREKLDEFGFNNTESILNEWNSWDSLKGKTVPLKNQVGAAYTASVFCMLQNSSVDKAMYYDAYPSRSFCGLFEFPDLKVTKTYFSFKAFNELYKLGNSVKTQSSQNLGIFSCAAISDDGTKAYVLLVNNGDESRRVKLDINAKINSSIIIDSEKTYMYNNDFTDSTSYLNMPEKSVMLLNVTPKSH